MNQQTASQPNWAKLVSQGRAKAIGVPWNDEELKARYKEGVPADYVRKGILTREDYLDEIKEEKKQKEKQEVKKVSKSDDKNNKIMSYEELKWPTLKSLAAKRNISAKKKKGIVKELRKQDKAEENPFSLHKISKMSTKKLVEKASEELDVDINMAMPRPNIVEQVLTASGEEMGKEEPKVDKNNKDK